MQQLMSYMRSAMERYNMIENGDNIAVGVSGGKDSVALLVSLAEMRRFYPVKYSLKAIMLDPCFNNIETDCTKLYSLCEKLGVEFFIKRTDLYDIIFNIRKEANPCSLCARMRRGILHDICKELGCNKIALGHHMDDAVETFYMNLLSGGSATCFSPVSYLDRKDLYLIRPLVFTPEKHIIKVVNKLKLPIVKSKCPVDGITGRQKIREYIKMLEKDYGALTQKTINALQKGSISGWGV